MKQQLIIRISPHSLSFVVSDPSLDGGQFFLSYPLNVSASMAANMRNALAEEPVLGDAFRRVYVMADASVMLLPVEEFDEEECASLYAYSFHLAKTDTVQYSVLPDLNAVAVYPVNRDLSQVIADHFVRPLYMPLQSSVWHHLHRRSHTSQTIRKLYAYFHDKKLEVFAFRQHRFRFYCTYDAARVSDAAYYILSVWKQLSFDVEKDELYVVGDIPEREQMLAELRGYLRNAYTINPTADFNRAPITQVKGVPYDVMALVVNGRN